MLAISGPLTGEGLFPFPVAREFPKQILLFSLFILVWGVTHPSPKSLVLFLAFWQYWNPGTPRWALRSGNVYFRNRYMFLGRERLKSKKVVSFFPKKTNTIQFWGNVIILRSCKACLCVHELLAPGMLNFSDTCNQIWLRSVVLQSKPSRGRYVQCLRLSIACRRSHHKALAFLIHR